LLIKDHEVRLTAQEDLGKTEFSTMTDVGKRTCSGNIVVVCESNLKVIN